VAGDPLAATAGGGEELRGSGTGREQQAGEERCEKSVAGANGIHDADRLGGLPVPDSVEQPAGAARAGGDENGAAAVALEKGAGVAFLATVRGVVAVAGEVGGFGGVELEDRGLAGEAAQLGAVDVRRTEVDVEDAQGGLGKLGEELVERLLVGRGAQREGAKDEGVGFAGGGEGAPAGLDAVPGDVAGDVVGRRALGAELGADVAVGRWGWRRMPEVSMPQARRRRRSSSPSTSVPTAEARCTEQP
jgi:hypothetical protein